MARRRSDAGRSRASEVVERLVDAWRARDATALAEVLHPRVALTAEGLGRTTDAPVRGAGAVATVLLGLTAAPADDEPTVAEATGMPAVVLRAHGRVRGVVVVEVHRGRVARLWAMLNPAKLGTWA